MLRHTPGRTAVRVFEEIPGRRSAAKLLSKDEARRIAAGIAKQPELVRYLNRARQERHRAS